MSDLTQAILNLELDLSAEEIAKLTRESGSEWPDRLIEDYITKIENLLRLSRSLDLNNDNTDFLLAQEGLSTHTVNTRKADPDKSTGIQPNISRRNQQDIRTESTGRRESDFEPVAQQQRREQSVGADFAMPGRVKRLSIDDLTVESIISGNISTNLNATPANTVAQLELKDKAGNTYYLPLYGAPW